nr:endonuclease domain-containing protein [Oricola cellulosilytica]
MTKSEVALWYELRDLREMGLKFRRRAPIRPYIVDFVCLAHKLAVEVDGDSHESESRKRHDANRDEYLRSKGYRVVRVDSPDVTANAWQVAQGIASMIEHECNNPTRPLGGHPPLRGEGKDGA